MQGFAVRMNGVGKRSVLMSVPVQANPEPPSTKVILKTDFLRSAIAVSSTESWVVQRVGTVHELAAAFAKGDSVKCRISAMRTASSRGTAVEKSSTTCEEPCVHGSHASDPKDGSTRMNSTRPSEPWTRASMARARLPRSSFTRRPNAPSEEARRRATYPPAIGVQLSICETLGSARTVATRSGPDGTSGEARAALSSRAGSEALSIGAIPGARNAAGRTGASSSAREGISMGAAAAAHKGAATKRTAKKREIIVLKCYHNQGDIRAPQHFG